MSDSEKPAEATPRRKRKQPVRRSLASLPGIIAEATKIYRLARTEKMDDKRARSLIWMLSEIRQMVEAQKLAEIEARLAELGEVAGIGLGRANVPARSAAVH